MQEAEGGRCGWTCNGVRQEAGGDWRGRSKNKHQEAGKGYFSAGLVAVVGLVGLVGQMGVVGMVGLVGLARVTFGLCGLVGLV